MASTQAFVQMVLNSVCLPQAVSTVSSMTQEQWEATYSTACDVINKSLRSQDGQLTELVRRIKPESLRGQTIRMAVKRLPTPAYLSSPFEPDRWSFRVIDFLAGLFNFTAEYVPARPATGGVHSLSDSGWTGLTGQLIRKVNMFSILTLWTVESILWTVESIGFQEVNISASLLAATSDRINMVAFGESLGHSEIGMMIQTPTAETRDDSLLAPFSRQVWILILVSMLVMGPVIWLIIRFRVWLAPGETHLNRVIPLASCIWFVYGGLMRQGTTLHPNADSSRLLFASWWIFITVLTAFYTANLTAYMTFSSLKIPIQTLQDLSASEHSWIAPAGDSIQMFVEGSETLWAMYGQGRGSFISEYETPSLIVRKVHGGGYVYIDEVSKLKAMMMSDYYNNNKTCSVYVVTLKDQYLKLSLAAPKGSLLLDVFDPTIQWLVMTGIAPKWSQDAAVDSAPCEASVGIQSTKLNRDELRMIFLLMLFAYGSACGLLVLELAFSWLVRRFRRALQLTPQLAQHAQTISAVQQVVLHARSGSDVKEAWLTPAGRKSSAWASSFVGTPLAVKSKEGVSSAGGGSAADRQPMRSDQEVVRAMKANIRRVNGRPYIFVRTNDGLRPVPVTQEKNKLLMSIFNRLKRQSSDQRPDG